MNATCPDVAPTAECQEYEAARQQLRQAYGVLGISCASDAVLSTIDKAQLGGMILQQVEGVVRDRVTGHVVATRELYAIGAACLRICGVAEDRVEKAVRTCVL